MISVVCVYNNREVLDRVLLPSLREETVEHEEILLNNTKGQFKSASAALNYGGSQATGKYIMFVHQDIELGSKTWLADTEKILDAIPDLGIAGVIGRDETGKTRGVICDRGETFGTLTLEPVQVQTLDEVVLIVPSYLLSTRIFDTNIFDGWHCYGVDYCIAVKSLGLGIYTIPSYVYHRSKDSTRSLSTQRKYQRRLYQKHKSRIYSTNGTITWFSAYLFPVWDILFKMYRWIFPTWIEWLKRDTRDCESALDIGCGYNSPVQYCDIPYKVGVEIYKPYLEESRKKALHNEYVESDIREVSFGEKSFDVVLASEVLEHLYPSDSNLLLGRMSVWAKKTVIITTPNGYLPQSNCDNNSSQEHKCGWTVDGLRARGYKVRGMNGLKYLKGPQGKPKYKPVFLWSRISDITQLFTRYIPRLAFQLYAVKEIK